jgi:hypothetical protein
VDELAKEKTPETQIMSGNVIALVVPAKAGTQSPKFFIKVTPLRI